MLEALGDIKDQSSVPLLLDLATQPAHAGARVQAAALGVLARFGDDAIAAALLAAYPHQGENWKSQAREVLLSRVSWARMFLAEVDLRRIPASDVTLEQLGRFATLRLGEAASLVRKHWGVTRGATREEKLAEVRRLNNDLRAGAGEIRARAQALSRPLRRLPSFCRRGRDHGPGPLIREPA